MAKILVSLMLVIFSNLSFCQDKSNRGKEFWLAYGYDYAYTNTGNSQELAIYISSELAATVTVTITNTSYSQVLTIPANTVNATILIPKSGTNDARTLTDGLQNRNIHIVSTENIAVYAHHYNFQLSGATMLMPVETYGFTYRSINYYQTTSESSPIDWYSWFYVVASEDNTRLTITPSDTTKNGWFPNQTYTINLNKGESYHVFGKAIFNGIAADASKDMTGSKVVSIPGADGVCHRFAMFSGSAGLRLCRGDGGEFVHQQVFPTQAWGTRYLTYHTINNPNTNITETNRNYYRICVLDPTTVVRRNGVVMTGLVNNFFYEHMDSTGGDYFTADKPFMVSQYTPNKNQCWMYNQGTYGDPEMFYLSPIEQGQKSVRFYVSRKSTIDFVYANILLPTSGVASLRVDGNVIPAAQIVAHPNYPSYSVALTRFIGPAAQHTISSDSAFNATVYGLGTFESYGYNVGTLINNLNHYGAIANVNNSNGQTDTFTCKNTPLRLFVKLAYPATSIHWKLSQVPGISPGTDSIINNPVAVGTEIINGRTYYIYTLQQDFTLANTGTFYLPVSFTSTVIENCSQTEEATIKIVVKDGPTASYNYSSGLCLDDMVSFTGNSVAAGFNITRYEWLFDDNSTAATVNTTKQFLTAGPHDVRYRIIADNGCVDDTIRTVNILDQPVATFGVDASICQRDSVYITDTSTVASGTITTWYWDFGDGNTEVRTNGNPFYHQYAIPGPYEIKLMVSAANGCSSDTVKKTVTVLAKPTASFTYNRDVCLGQSIQFSDNSIPVSGSITAWHWNFADGNTVTYSNGNPFNYTYTAVNSYNVALVVQGSNSCLSDTFRTRVNVTDKPSSAFTYAGRPCIDSNFIFTSATTYNAAVPSAWYWSFGDGQAVSVNNGNQANHTYSAAGSNIRVRHAVSYGGCPSDTTDQFINLIAANPAAAFNAAAAAWCEGMPVTVTGSGSADISSWNWNMGNGILSGPPPFTHVYNTAGRYTIALTVRNAAGCQSEVTAQQVDIAVKPVVDAGPDIYKRETESKIILATTNNPAGYSFTWSPGNYLGATNILTPVTTAPTDILYRVTVTDRVSNCVATDSMNVKIISTIYVPNAFTPNGDGKHETWRIPALSGYPNAVVMIFNRYSQKIYESKGYNNPWDGTFKGQPQPIGAYIYLIDPGEPGMKPLKGTVTIIR